jgi:uncharacterized Tic20 family protein
MDPTYRPHLTPPANPRGHPFDDPSYVPTDDEKTWGLLAHGLSVFLGFLGPVLALAAKGNESKWVRAHAIEALNFHLLVFIVYTVSAILSVVVIGLCILIPAALAAVILAIIAGVTAFHGKPYRYPFNVRLIKD